MEFTVLNGIVIFTLAIALIFDVINGFHDAANSIATIVSTRVLQPRYAVLWAAFFNFVAILIFAPHVADTISKIVTIKTGDATFIFVVCAGLLGAIFWNLLTWFLGLPSSSSHALIGGLMGAGLTYKGVGVINWFKIKETILFIPVAPLMGMVGGFCLMVCVLWIFRKWKPQSVDFFFRKGQLVSAALYSIGHGANDAQKTMGIMVALLVAAGWHDGDKLKRLWDCSLNESDIWIMLSCQIAMALGTAMGGWRIVKTMGMKITTLKPYGGFCAETGGALTIFFASHFGIPVSTTHVITGSIVGVGATAGRLSAVKWGVAGRIIWAWIFTIPAAAIVSSLTFFAFKMMFAEHFADKITQMM